jgi:hypothetical protein
MIDNLKIELNATIIQKLKSEDIYPDHMGSVICILVALSKKRVDLLDELDDFNKSKRLILLYKQLEHRGFLELANNSKNIFNLTQKGSKMVLFLEEQFAKQNIDIDAVVLESEPEVAMIAAKPVETVDHWIGEYNNMFPKQFQNNDTVLARRMEIFMKTFPNYSKEDILGGTKMYIQEQEESQAGHNFTRQAQYLIFKGNGVDRLWDLATWCKKYKERGDVAEYDTKFLDMA